MNKQKLMQRIVLVTLVGSTFFSGHVYAQTPGGPTHMNFFQEFIQFISQRFGLEKSAVQSALSDFRQQKRATITPRPTLSPEDRLIKETARLDLLVKDGKITKEQESAILTELALLRTKYPGASLANLTPEQRKSQIDAMRSEIVSWAKSHGIDSSYVMPGFGMGRQRGMGEKADGKRWNGPKNTNVTPTQ